MMLVLVLLLAGIASAQTNEDARSLLQEIAGTSRAAKSWLAEGIEVGDVTGRGMLHVRDETRFKVAYQRPSRMLWDSTTNETANGVERPLSSPGTLAVCDGIDHWMYYKQAGFSRGPVGISPCAPEEGDFGRILEDLVTAKLAGRDHVQFAGADRECQVVQAEYAVIAPADGVTVKSARTFCIDPVQKLILRDHREMARNNSDLLLVQTTTYSRYERDIELPAEFFQFQVPTGTVEADGAGPDLMSLELISKVEPSYTEEALRTGISGIVIVSLRVSAEGRPEEMAVVRGLGHGLDEKAIEAVRQWRFRPGTRGGVPTAVGPLKVAVSFRRP